MMTLTPEQRQAIREAGGEPIRLEDPETKQAYVLIEEDTYRRLQAVLEYDDRPLSVEEQLAILAHVGRRAGWDDPAMDVYNDLDPRRGP